MICINVINDMWIYFRATYSKSIILSIFLMFSIKNYD